MTQSPLDKLQGLFSGGKASEGMNAEKFKSLLERSLSETPTGHRLLAFADKQHIAIQVVPGKDNSAYLPEQRAVIITMPPGLSTVPAETVLELAAFIRQAETQFLGHKNPDKSMTSDEYAVAFDTKIIDSLAIMCRIALECADKGNTAFVDAITRMGHSKLYETYRKYGTGKEFAEAYFKTADTTV